jgi:Domain of unknown function (DUF4350)
LKQRLVTFGLALGALFACYALFLPKPHATDQSSPRPVTTEDGAAGYQAAWRWLQAEHVRESALHQRFDRLSDATLSARATGNVLVTTLPHELPVQPQEASQLEAWVESGNTLIVAAALDDTPQWAGGGSARLLKDVERLSRLKFDTDNDDQKNAKPSSPSRSLKSTLEGVPEPTMIKIEPRGNHFLMDGIHSLSVLSDLPASRWRATPMDNSAVLQVAQTGSGEGAIFIRRQAKGQVITLAVAGLFSNRDIGSTDNAKLLSNIVAWTLQPGATVIFDDMHQGAVGYYDAKKFFADPRLHRTLLWLVFLWLAFVLGVQHLRFPARDWRAADMTAFVSASGDFLASSVTASAAASRILANFFDSLRRRPGVPTDDSGTWKWLSAQPSVSAQEVAELQNIHGRILRGQGFDLKRLQDLVSQLKGKMA